MLMRQEPSLVGVGAEKALFLGLGTLKKEVFHSSEITSKVKHRSEARNR